MNNKYHHGLLKETLINLGLQELESIGRDKLSLRNLSEKAGVSKTAPYRHFANKDDFLMHLANEGFHLLYISQEVALKQGKFALKKMGEEYMKFAVEHPELYRLMNSPLSCQMPHDKMIWARKTMEALGAVFGKNEFDSNTAAAAWGYIHGLVLLRIDSLFPSYLPEPDWELLSGDFFGILNNKANS